VTKFGMKSPSRVFVSAFMGSLNQLGFSLTLLNLTHVAKSASFVEQVISSIDVPHASAAWPTNSIIGLTTEVLRKRTREERSIEVQEEMAEVVVGGPKITVRQGAIFSKGYRRLIGLISFVVDPDVLKRVLKHGAQAVLESEPDLTRWDAVSIAYYLRLVFPTYH
jgi:dihydroxyacetone kinase